MNLADSMPTDEMIRRIIGRNKIKYNTMTTILEDINIKKMKSFIINIDSILIDLHKYMDNTEILDQDIVQIISSSIINIAAHYRYYFSINGSYPNIYLLGDMNDNNESIKSALNIISIILTYIDNIYFIDTSSLNTGIVIKYFLSKKNINVILTRDDFDIMHISENTSVIKANKDNSKIYTVDNWQSVMCGDKYDIKYSIISHELINMILCFAGAHGRNGIKGLGIRSMIKKIYKALNSKMIINSRYSNIDDFISDTEELFTKYDLNPAIYNFNTYDIDSNYSKYITKPIEKRLDSYIKDKFSKKDLTLLNSTYFTGVNYLMLQELFTKPKTKKEIKWL